MSDWILPNRLMFTNWIYETFNPSKYVDEKSYFKADPSQRLIGDYLNYNSPYRGVLIYHGLGTGKTCTSILATDSFVNKHQKVVILLPASLENNYRKELKKCSRTGSMLRGKWCLVQLVIKEDIDLIDTIDKEIGVSRDFIEDQDGSVWLPSFLKIPAKNILEKDVLFKTMSRENQDKATLTYEHIIDKRYTFLHYNGITAKKLEQLEKSDAFENSIVVIDEVHSFISRVVNGGKIARRLYNILIDKSNIRFVLLSGTPVINHPFELAYTLNLLRGSIKEYVITTLKNEEFPPIEELIEKLEKEKVYNHIDTIELGTDLRITLLPKGFVRKSKEDIAIVKGPFYKDGDSFMKKIVAILKKSYKLSTKIKTVDNAAFPDKKEDFIKYFFDTTDPMAPVVNKENQEMFMRRLQGIVSYYRISDEGMFPTALEPSFHKVPMSNQQFAYYAERRNIELKQEDKKATKENQMRNRGIQLDLFQTNSSYRAYSRMACNFVFPEKIKRPFPKDVKLLKKEIDVDSDDEMDEEKKAPKLNDAKLYELEVNKALDKLDDEGDQYLTGDGLYECSPKMHTLLADLKRNTKTKSLLYSQFRTVEGLRIFRMVLNHDKWKEIDFKPIGDGDWEIINAEKVLKPEYDYKRYLVFGSKQKTDMLISLFNADIKNLPKTVQAQLKKYKYTENMYGNLASLLMITQSGAEGLNLRNVRFVYILEPFWNQVRIDQVIGRAIRKGSHLDLPEKERNVQVVIYISSLTEKQKELNKTIKLRDGGLTTDEDIFSIATRKNKIISQFLTMLKANSIDCLFHAKENKPLIHNYKCHIPPINENLNKLTYNPNIETSTKTFGVRERSKKVKGRAVLFNKVKYVKLPDSDILYDYNAYKYAGVLTQVKDKTVEKEVIQKEVKEKEPKKEKEVKKKEPKKEKEPKQEKEVNEKEKEVKEKEKEVKEKEPKKEVKPPKEKEVKPPKEVKQKPVKPVNVKSLQKAQIKVLGPHPVQLCEQTREFGETDIEGRLELYGFEMVDDRYDQNGGNCLFSAFLNQLKQHGLAKDGETPETLRKKAVEWLEKNLDYILIHYGAITVRDAIKENPKRYLTRMKKDNAWGDEIVLYALVVIYNVEVGVISTLKNNCELLEPPSENAPPIGRLFIGSIKDKHFVSTRVMKKFKCE